MDGKRCYGTLMHQKLVWQTHRSKGKGISCHHVHQVVNRCDQLFANVMEKCEGGRNLYAMASVTHG